MKKTEFLNTRKKIEQKNHGMVDKITTLDQAVNLINNGDTIALGGCLYSRTPIAMIREIIKKKLTDLTIIRNLVSLEGDWLLASNCLKKIITSWYSIGVTWGVSKVMRDYMENKKAIYEEWSHLGLNLRLKAAAMGVPFLPTFSMLGSDLLKNLSIKKFDCPYTGLEMCAVPAIFPDVAIIHAHRADKYGNVQIDGPPFIDSDVAYSATKVIVTVEEIISNEKIRMTPDRTMIPFFCVDAVVEVPFGSFPHECYGLYESDYEHFDEYTKMLKETNLKGLGKYLDKYIYNPDTFNDFLNIFSVKKIINRIQSGKEICNA